MTHKPPTRAILRKLHDICRHENTYSLSDTLVALGIEQNTAQKWFSNSPSFREILSTCYELCFANIDIGNLKAIIPEKKALQYAQENYHFFSAIHSDTAQGYMPYNNDRATTHQNYSPIRIQTI